MGVDEYCTSQYCSRCVRDGVTDLQRLRNAGRNQPAPCQEVPQLQHGTLLLLFDVSM